MKFNKLNQIFDSWEQCLLQIARKPDFLSIFLKCITLRDPQQFFFSIAVHNSYPHANFVIHKHYPVTQYLICRQSTVNTELAEMIFRYLSLKVAISCCNIFINKLLSIRRNPWWFALSSRLWSRVGKYFSRSVFKDDDENFIGVVHYPIWHRKK